MKKTIDVLFIAAMAALLIAPLVQMKFGIFPRPGVDELRMPRPYPDPLHQFPMLDTKLADEMNGWFDDTYGLRDILIRTKNELDYRLFGTSRKVIIGKDNWLYDQEAFDLTSANNDHAEEVEGAVLDTISNLRECLRRANVTLVFIISPDKATIYPEYLPFYARRPPAYGLIERVSDALRDRSDMIFIDAERMLRAHKSDIVFDKMDIHWSLRGAARVYHAMLERIAEASHRAVPPLRTGKFNAGYATNGSGSRFMAKWATLGEMRGGVTNAGTVLEDDEYGHWVTDIGVGALPVFRGQPEFDWRYESRRSGVELLPPTILFGTSFIYPIITLRYYEAFERLYHTRGNLALRMGPVLADIPPEVKFFVLEYPEYYLRRLTEFPVTQACGAAGRYSGGGAVRRPRSGRG